MSRARVLQLEQQLLKNNPLLDEAADTLERLEIVGDRLMGATSRLMAALHVESMCETLAEQADPGEATACAEVALAESQENTRRAWHDCVAAMDRWTALRMGLPANVAGNRLARQGQSG